MIRVLVVDDSAFVRQALTRMLAAAADVDVVGTAADGQEGVQKVLDLRPDVVTLDVKMPRLDGLEALRQIMARCPTPVLLLSSLTTEAGDVTLRGLELGAMDFIDKSSVQGNMNLLNKVATEVSAAEPDEHIWWLFLDGDEFHHGPSGMALATYLRTLDRVTRALVCFREHLAPGGVALVEPWPTPGVLDPAKRFTHAGEAQGVRVSRHSRVEIEGTLSRLLFDYEIEDHGEVRRFSEVHELGLFTTEEMMQAFQRAGLEVQHDPEGLTGRGLFVARSARP